jgi:hypothetical protein
LDAITVGNDADGAPYLSVDGKGRLPVSLSISHRGARAFCALSFSPSLSVGADIERVEPRIPAFVSDFFTSHEAGRVWACAPGTRDLLVSVVWSAKEAVLKALRQGLRVDTRRVEIGHVAGIAPRRTSPTGWHEVRVSSELPTTCSPWPLSPRVSSYSISKSLENRQGVNVRGPVARFGWPFALHLNLPVLCICVWPTHQPPYDFEQGATHLPRGGRNAWVQRVFPLVWRSQLVAQVRCT